MTHTTLWRTLHYDAHYSMSHITVWRTLQYVAHCSMTHTTVWRTLHSNCIRHHTKYSRHTSFRANNVYHIMTHTTFQLHKTSHKSTLGTTFRAHNVYHNMTVWRTLHSNNVLIVKSPYLLCEKATNRRLIKTSGLLWKLSRERTRSRGNKLIFNLYHKIFCT